MSRNPETAFRPPLAFAVALAVALALALGGVACGDREVARGDAHEDGHEDGHDDGHDDGHEDGGDAHEGEAARVELGDEAYAAAGVEIAAVERRALRGAVRVTGTLAYDERRMAVATARVGGRIDRVVADYGARVSAGQPLAWIDSPELGAAQAGYLRAHSLARLGEAEYDRARLLLAGDAISRGELLRREADWRAAQAELAAAEQELHLLGLGQDDVARLVEGADPDHVYPVRAPIAGRVTAREAVAGRVVDADRELFTVAELDPLWLFVQVFEKDLRGVRVGDEVTLTCEAHPEDRFHGRIDFVGQVLDPHSRTARARAVIDNPHGDLKPGMFVYATIHGAPDGDERPVLPRAAVTSIDGRDVVFVPVAPDAPGTHAFEARPVLLGAPLDGEVEVVAGVEPGERVAVAGVFLLKSELLKGRLEGHHH